MATTTNQPRRSTVRVRVEVSGEAEADLEALLGDDEPTQAGDEDRARKILKDAVGGCEFSVGLDGVHMMLRLDVG